MAFAYTQLEQQDIHIPGESNFKQITPFFMHINLLDNIQSEIQGKPVYEMMEVVQLRFAGDRYYSPVLKVDEMYRRVGQKVITYAERWADQYRQFLQGEAQVAEGTPLDNLTTHGITPAQLSLCRALKIYSIEALHHLEGANLKSLGSHANDLKPMAKKWMADRANGNEQLQRIAELEAKIAGMQAQVVVPKDIATPEEIDIAYLGAMTSDELHAIILEKTGAKADGRMKHENLVNLVKGL